MFHFIVFWNDFQPWLHSAWTLILIQAQNSLLKRFSMFLEIILDIIGTSFFTCSFILSLFFIAVSMVNPFLLWVHAKLVLFSLHFNIAVASSVIALRFGALYVRKSPFRALSKE